MAKKKAGEKEGRKEEEDEVEEEEEEKERKERNENGEFPYDPLKIGIGLHYRKKKFVITHSMISSFMMSLLINTLGKYIHYIDNIECNNINNSNNNNNNSEFYSIA